MGKKVYVVFNGRNPEIYHTWEECQAQVVGFGHASFRGFTSDCEAIAAWEAFAGEAVVPNVPIVELPNFDTRWGDGEGGTASEQTSNDRIGPTSGRHTYGPTSSTSGTRGSNEVSDGMPSMGCLFFCVLLVIFIVLLLSPR